MTTVLIVGNSEGEKRCDAKCHDATDAHCECICGGRYHGASFREIDLGELVRADIERGVFPLEVHEPGVMQRQMQMEVAS